MPLSWKAGSESTAHIITEEIKITPFWGFLLLLRKSLVLAVLELWVLSFLLATDFLLDLLSPGKAKLLIYMKSEWNIPQISISLSKWFSVLKDLGGFGCSKVVFSKYLSLLLFVPFPRIIQAVSLILSSPTLNSPVLIEICIAALLWQWLSTDSP